MLNGAQGSTDHRGTPEAPGRTVTLVPGDEDSIVVCCGRPCRVRWQPRLGPRLMQLKSQSGLFPAPESRQHVWGRNLMLSAPVSLVCRTPLATGGVCAVQWGAAYRLAGTSEEQQKALKVMRADLWIQRDALSHLPAEAARM